jgi:carboxylate-amine ligase
VEVNYGRRAPFSLGIEEEFQLLSSETFELAQRYDDVAEAVGADERIKPELLRSTAEAATDVSATVAEAIEHARELRRRLTTAAAERGVVIASAGTHPFSRYEHQDVTDAERYRELTDSMRWVADRQLIFGLHVHVGLETAHQAIAVGNRVRTWLPELLALSANSPFWQGRDTGLASTRSKVFDTFPRSGLPPAFASFEEFELLVERGVKTNSFEDYTYIWWDLRPHPRLGTLEVRICDAQTRVESLTAIVALVHGLVAAAAEDYARAGTLQTEPVTLIAENRWRAARDGLAADLIDLEHDTERPAREAVLALVERAQPTAKRLGSATELGEVERLLERGSGADEQRRARESGGTLLAVARRLAEWTAAGL